ncbi:MAG: class I SAM-dependent DNA methyltransferase [Lachnospiraceae bacterium]
MASYKRFARMYDMFMRDIPYDRWAEYVIERLRAYGINPQHSGQAGELILELGCGTGNMSRYLCMEGYRVVGIDLSPYMVKEASRKLIPGFEAYVGDMRVPFFREGRRCRCIVSLCDSMNYLVKNSDLELAVKAAATQLEAGGIFLFDMKTEEFFKEELGDNVFADRRKKAAYIWENNYDTRRHLNTYNITFYYRTIGRLYGSFTEHHVQRAYSRRHMADIAGKYGFTLKECSLRGEREYYILQKI